MFKNGREVTLRFRITEGATVNLEKEYDGKELNEIIDEWLKELCVQSRFNVSDMTENQMFVEQARIPLLNESLKPMDTREFMQIFRKRLKKPPYNLNSKVYLRGLGEAWIIIGGNEEP